MPKSHLNPHCETVINLLVNYLSTKVTLLLLLLMLSWTLNTHTFVNLIYMHLHGIFHPEHFPISVADFDKVRMSPWHSKCTAVRRRWEQELSLGNSAVGTSEFQFVLQNNCRIMAVWKRQFVGKFGDSVGTVAFAGCFFLFQQAHIYTQLHPCMN